MLPTQGGEERTRREDAIAMRGRCHLKREEERGAEDSVGQCPFHHNVRYM